jgi:uncharacterized membrane protein YuzA (DUF378 family)
MRKLYLVMFILVIIGAINWGLVGLVNMDLVAMIFGPMSIISRIIYVLVGVSGVGMLFCIKCFFTSCDKDMTCNK